MLNLTRTNLVTQKKSTKEFSPKNAVFGTQKNMPPQKKTTETHRNLHA